MQNNSTLNSQIVEEASHWALKIEDGALTSQDRIDLAAWLKTSPVHVDELLLAGALLTGLSHVDPDKKILINEIMRDGADVVPLDSASVTSEPTVAPERGPLSLGRHG